MTSFIYKNYDFYTHHQYDFHKESKVLEYIINKISMWSQFLSRYRRLSIQWTYSC